MKYLRNKRGLAGLGALAAVIGVTLWVVLPAFASTSGSPSNSSNSSTPGDYVGPPSTGPTGSKTAWVYPRDVAVGGNGTCSNLFNDPNSPNYDNTFPTTSELDNSNPKPTNGLVPSGKDDGASFGLSFQTVNGSKGVKNEYLDLSSSGAQIFGIGINGGNDSTAYNYNLPNTSHPDTPGSYDPTSDSPVTADTWLHAPAQSYGSTSVAPDGVTIEGAPYQLYSISHLTICYLPVLSISGTVYNDLDQSGAQSATDPGLPGWTVTLYKGSTAVTPSATTASDGSYSLSVPYDKTSTYTLCEAPPADPPTTWKQKTPTTSACASMSGQLSNGYTVTSSASNFDFGNVQTYLCPVSGSDTAGLGPSYYKIGNCKSGDTYTFPLGTAPPGTTTADGVDISGNPYIGSATTTPASTTVPTVEHLAIPDPYNGAQPEYTHVLYTPDGSNDLSKLSPMPYCNFDPRGASPATSFTLLDGYSGSSNITPDGSTSGSGAVIPAGNNDTACVISVATSAPVPPSGSSTVPAGTPGTLEAWVYALNDATRAFR